MRINGLLLVIVAVFYFNNTNAVTYYVNDGSTVGDVFCTAVGNAGNNGLTAATPNTTIQYIVNTYNLNAGDIINVDAGSYTQGTDITNATDMGGAGNPIIIRGAGTALTVMTAPAADDNFYLFDTRYITIRDMHLINTNANRYNVHMFNGNYYTVDVCILDNSNGTNVLMNTSNQTYDIDYNTVSNCVINNTSTNDYAIHIWGDADWDTIRNNTITCTGTSAAYAILLDDYSSGLSSEWPTDTWIFDNAITADDYGIYSRADDGQASNGYEIFENVITITSSDQADGACIWFELHGVSSDRTNIKQNILSGGSNGIYFGNSVDQVITFNNFICNNPIGINVANANSQINWCQNNSFYNSNKNLYFVNSANDRWTIRNNIFYNSGGVTSHCIYVTGSAQLFQFLDYNIYYTPGGAYAGGVAAANYNFAVWQAANKDDPAGTLGDENSLNQDPTYNNPISCALDLTCTSCATGIFVGGVTTDIYGTARANPPTIGAWEEGSTLPVELIRYTIACDEGAKLSWATATETNNDYFTIEKSLDGFDFYEIERIIGGGNSSTVLQYEYVDFETSGLAYYKLTQTDFDGTTELLGILAATCYNENGGLHVFPNPTTGVISIDLGDEPTSFTITNSIGQIVDVMDGSGVVSVDMSAYPRGVYFVNAKGMSSKVIKY